MRKRTWRTDLWMGTGVGRVGVCCGWREVFGGKGCVNLQLFF